MKHTFSTTTDFDKVIAFLDTVFASPTHYPEWNTVISKHFNTEFFYNICSEGETLIGIEPIHVIYEGLVKKRYTGPKQYLIPYGGWIFKGNQTVEPSTINNSSTEVYCGFTLPVIPQFGVEKYKVENFETKETILTNLTLTEEEIWSKEISSKRRNMIRKAEKSGVTVEIVGAGTVPQLYDIIKTSNDFYGLTTFAQEFFQELFDTSNNIVFEAVLAKHEGRILSVLIMVRSSQFAIYWQGLNNGGGPNFGQGELLQWEAIKHAKRNGCLYYDLCSIEKERLPKIYEFKRDFGKTEVEFINFSVRPVLSRFLGKISSVLNG